MKLKYIIMLCVSAALLCQCRERAADEEQTSDDDALMLSGVWQSAEDDSYVFRVEGDTIYYSDRWTMPVHFRIYRDTIFLEGATVTKYIIEKFTPNVLQFRNQSGETVKLHKAQDKVSDAEFYSAEDAFMEINQQFQKRDTVAMAGDKRYHCYIQVNPTSYKVVKNNLNNEGMDVGRIYYDNIVNVAVYVGASRLYFHDFRKQEFAAFVPEDIMPLCILSDIVYKKCGTNGVTFQAYLRVPESASSYLAEILISPEGKMSLKARE